METHAGLLPPGVKVTQMLDIGVRAPAKPRSRKVDDASNDTSGDTSDTPSDTSSETPEAAE